MIYFELEKTNKILNKDKFNFYICENENIPCYNNILYKHLNKAKSLIDNCSEQWDTIKKYTNPYEFIHTIIPGYKHAICKLIPLSRAFYKMIEICQVFELVEEDNKLLNSFHLAEGPGGFIEALTYLRKNPLDTYTGMTLINTDEQTPGWKKSANFLKNHQETVKLEFGKSKNGDLYLPENFEYIYKKYKGTQDLVTADGGFDFSCDFNNQENMILRLLYTEICYALILQKTGGNFILKMFDLFLKPTIDIIYMLSLCYETVSISKPTTSRSANSEKYIICKNMKNIDKEELFKEFYNHLTILQKEPNKYLCNIIHTPPEQGYLNNIRELNCILGQNQLEMINTTMSLIEQIKKREKINSYKKQNIENGIHWCKKYKVPFNDELTQENIFLTSKG